MADGLSPESGWFAAAAAALGAGLGALGQWLASRAAAKPVEQATVNQQFQALATSLQASLAAEREEMREERKEYRVDLERREAHWARHCALLQGQIAALLKGDPAEAERLRMEATLGAIQILPPLEEE